MKNMKKSKLIIIIMIIGLVMIKLILLSLESPRYETFFKNSEFEVRFYVPTVWMSAFTNEISFRKATRDGFHRLFQFIQGANLNYSRVSMTTPLLTSIVPGAGPLHSSAYLVKFYLPTKFQSSPPLPLPELNLSPDSWSSRCIAVRKFSGFARDDNIVKEAEKLSISLSRSSWANSTSSESKFAYSIAQYNSPFKLIGRVNEVWVELKKSPSHGCSNEVAAS